jgi:hypothetical protein
MLQAIGTLLSKTIDVYLQLSSPEVRQRKLGKQLFKLYSCLDDVEACMTALRNVVVAIADSDDQAPFFHIVHRLPGSVDIHSLSSTGEMDILVRSVDERGDETTTEYRRVLQRDFLPAAMSAQISALSQAIGDLSKIMEAEAWELWHQPELLKRVDVFQPGLGNVVVDAWFMDGGFVEALLSLDPPMRMSIAFLLF